MNADELIESMSGSKIYNRFVRYARMPLENLEIRFLMAAPVYAFDPIYFDSILGYFIAQEEGLSSDEIVEIPMPLKLFDCNDAFWAASVLSPIGPVIHGMSSWKKRWDEQYDDYVMDPERSRLKIDHKAGFFKAYKMPVPYYHTQELIAYATGNYDEVSRLLRECSFLGKKRSQGWGQVRDIEIKVSSDKSEKFSWYGDGGLRRPVPFKFFRDQGMMDVSVNRGAKVQSMRVRCPYWIPDGQVACAI